MWGWSLHSANDVHYSRYATSIILRITYGKSSPTSIDDPEFVGVKQIVEHFIEGMRPGGYLVDRFPWLKYVPGYGRRLKGYYESDLKFYRGQLDRVKYAMVKSFIFVSEHIGATQEHVSHRMMLVHRFRERCWKTSMKIYFPSMRSLSSLELSSKPDLTRYNNAFATQRMNLIGVHRLQML